MAKKRKQVLMTHCEVCRAGIARVIGSLFVNGNGQQAERMVLVNDTLAQSNLGGWGKEPMIDRVCKMLEIE